MAKKDALAAKIAAAQAELGQKKLASEAAFKAGQEKIEADAAEAVAHAKAFKQKIFDDLKAEEAEEKAAAALALKEAAVSLNSE